MTFKINDIVTYKDEKLKGEYRVVSVNYNDYWLQKIEYETMYLKYSPEIMKKI